ncbi:hypothetical protein [Nisaea sp.]|uniref:hypothetical protein n=1 Tax=Nisaea sp. TaxID=2024842 RepID=UPI003B5171FC
MLRRLTAFCAVLTLVACAGREPVMVESYQRHDEQMSCAEIDREIGRNNAAIRARVVESSDRTGRNAMVGAVGILLFWPALFALDLKDGAGQEMTGFAARNNTLVQYGRERGCDIQIALDIETAKAEYAARFDEDGNFKPDAGEVKAATSDRSALRPTAVAASRSPVDPGSRDALQNLMNAFLNGDIDQAEYERRRAALGS